MLIYGSSGCHDNAQFHIFFLSVHIYMKDSENGLLHQTKHLIKLKFMYRHLLGKIPTCVLFYPVFHHMSRVLRGIF